MGMQNSLFIYNNFRGNLSSLGPQRGSKITLSPIFQEFQNTVERNNSTDTVSYVRLRRLAYSKTENYE
jgi:hypothetical protein